MERSPNYPSIGPSEALKYAEKIWKEDKRHEITLDAASQHFGYARANGASLPIIGALKRYGLVVTGSSGMVKISDDAHHIFLAPHDHPEKTRLIREMAMRPALFREAIQKYPGDLPSNATLRFWLQKDKGFASEKAADTFIAALRDAMSLAGVGPDNRDAETESFLDDEESAPMSTPAAIANPHPPVTSVVSVPVPMPPPVVGSIVDEKWSLGGTVRAQLVITGGELNARHLRMLKRHVDLLVEAHSDDEVSD